MKNCPISNISLVSRVKSAIMLYKSFNFLIIWYLNVLKSQSRSFKVIRTSIFRIRPREMKIFKKTKLDKTLTSRTAMRVIDPRKADFRVTFFVRHHLVALEVEYGSSLISKYDILSSKAIFSEFGSKGGTFVPSLGLRYEYHLKK